MSLNKIRPCINKGNIVCDIGCGKHMDLLKQTSRLATKSINIDSKIPAILTKNYSNLEVKTFQSGYKIPLDDKSIDIFTLLAVFEYLGNPRDILKEVRRILKPNGLFLITVPSIKAKGIREFLPFKLNIIYKEDVFDNSCSFSLNRMKDLMVSDNFEQIKLESFKFGFNIFFCGRKID